MKKFLCRGAVLLAMLCSTVLQIDAQSLTGDNQSANKEIVIRMNALFNEGRATEAMAFYSDSLVKGGNINGKSVFVAMQEDILNTFPDVQTKITELWADGDWVIAKCIFSGTHKGTARLPHHGAMLVNAEPSHKSFSVVHIRMYKIKAGKIVARQAVRDDLGMLQQLGFIAGGKPR